MNTDACSHDFHVYYTIDRRNSGDISHSEIEILQLEESI